MYPSPTIGGSIALLFYSGVTPSDLLSLAVLVLGVGAIAAVHGSLGHHLARVSDLCRDVEDLYRTRSGTKAETRLRDLEKLMASSPVVGVWTELLRQRHELEAKSPDDSAPVRFADLLAAQPLIPAGMRRSLLVPMPLLLAGGGLAASLAAISIGLAGLPSGASAAMVVGLGLRGAFWGLVLATAAGVGSHVMHGTSDELGARLSKLMERTYRVVSKDEVALRIAEAQLAGQERNSLLLARLTKDLRESLSAGLVRIEDAAGAAADAANEEQRAALVNASQDIAQRLQHRLEDQLGALRTTMELHATDPGDKKKKRAEEDERQASAALERAAQAVEQAASALARNAEAASQGEQGGDLGAVAGVLENAVVQIEEAQQEAGEEGASADAIAGLRTEVTQMHEQMVESVLAARESRTGASAMVGASESGGDDDGARAEDDGPRSGYSALLGRYQAPRFSLDELSPELRSFDSESAIERARAAGVAPDGSLVPQDAPAPETPAPAVPQADPGAPVAPDPAQPPVAADDAPVDAEAEAAFEADDEPDEEAGGDPVKAADEQRLRLAQFLKRR